MRTANPAMKSDLFAPAETWGASRAPATEAARSNTMSLSGTVSRTLVLLGLCVATAVFAWGLVLPSGGGQAKVSPMLPLLGGAIGGLILALATIFKPRWAPVTAPLYALAEGFFVGAASALFAVSVGQTEGGALQPNYGMIMQAVTLTFGILAVMLIAYGTRIIKPTEKFKAGVVAATGGIMLVYLATWILGFLGVSIPFIHGSGWLGIGFSLFVIVIASLNLILDFDLVEQGVQQGAPKFMEWYAGFALLVTLVWLYIEVLRLLAKLQGRE